MPIVDTKGQKGFDPKHRFKVIEEKPITNADRVRSMTDDEINEWYWWMLHYVQGYTDSRVALREWLKEEYKE